MSTVYTDADQFEDLFTRLFDEIEEADDQGLAPLVKSHMVICFAVSEPEIEMWVDGREAPVRTTFGPSDLRATLTASLTGDHLHELLPGTLPLGKAMRQRKLKMKGSKFKALKLESLLHACQSGYPALAEEMLPGDQ